MSIQETRVETNSDRREYKLPTFYDDWYPGRLRHFIENEPGLIHLKRPPRYWRAPRGTYGLIKYSTVSAEHKAAAKCRQKRGGVKRENVRTQGKDRRN